MTCCAVRRWASARAAGSGDVRLHRGGGLLLTHLLSGRAAYIHVGAMIGTIMVGNVLMVIIPGQRKLVEP
jgi:hypothetical protein